MTPNITKLLCMIAALLVWRCGTEVGNGQRDIVDDRDERDKVVAAEGDRVDSAEKGGSEPFSQTIDHETVAETNSEGDKAANEEGSMSSAPDIAPMIDHSIIRDVLFADCQGPLSQIIKALDTSVNSKTFKFSGSEIVLKRDSSKALAWEVMIAESKYFLTFDALFNIQKVTDLNGKEWPLAKCDKTASIDLLSNPVYQSYIKIDDKTQAIGGALVTQAGKDSKWLVLWYEDILNPGIISVFRMFNIQDQQDFIFRDNG